jgi:hypothetical protein
VAAIPEAVRITCTMGLVNAETLTVPPDLRLALYHRVAYFVQNHGDEPDMAATNEGLKFSIQTAFAPVVKQTYAEYRKPLSIKFV